MHAVRHLDCPEVYLPKRSLLVNCLFSFHVHIFFKERLVFPLKIPNDQYVH